MNIVDFLGRLWTVPDRFEIGFRLFPQSVQQPRYFSLSTHSAWQSSAPATNSPPLKVRPDDASTREGFARFYNNDYEAAITLFEQAQKNHPDDPFAANHLLQAVLVQELEREGALSAQLYVGNDFLRTKKVSVSPLVRARIQDLISHSIGLSEQRLKANPRDADALYTLGAARALRAIYEGLIDKSWFPALRSALAAYRDHQQVLEISPNYDDAKLVVGVYNYVIAALPLYEKIAAFLLAITGSKSKGIEDVRQAANAGGEASIDAKTALSLFLAREHQYPEAVQLMRGLYAGYPHNFHFGLWEGDLLRASGSYPESVAAYRNLLSLAQQGYFPNARIAKAAYGLGESLRAQSKYGDAAESFESAAQFSGADSQMAARSKLSAGKMYDLQQRRDLAVKNYNEVLALAPDSTEAQEARRLLKQPYRNP
ncbi:MAG: tetratricopeptide repeat protein [Candidatus Acidiferrales bacterium]